MQQDYRNRALAAALAVVGGATLAVVRHHRILSPMPSHAAELVAEPASLGRVVALAPPGLLPTTNAFLAALTPEQRAKATYPLESDERMSWHYVPQNRNGIRMDTLNDVQQKAALELLRVSLSATGYKKVETIRSLENVLAEMENDTEGRTRNPGHYYVTVFGTPGEKGTWGWRFEGHHVSLNWTIADGKVIASTPQFFGANPAHVHGHGSYDGTRVLAAEEDLGRALLESLTPDQRKAAVLDEKAPAEILTGAERVASIQADKGIAYKDLTKDQKDRLLALISVHANAQTEAIAKQRLEQIRKAGMDNIKFAWMGSGTPGQGHYYRIQGATFLIEYDDTQNNANHIHTVWRDFHGDFGRDVLGEHLKTAHNGSTHP